MHPNQESLQLIAYRRKNSRSSRSWRKVTDRIYHLTWKDFFPHGLKKEIFASPGSFFRRALEATSLKNQEATVSTMVLWKHLDNFMEVKSYPRRLAIMARWHLGNQRPYISEYLMLRINNGIVTRHTLQTQKKAPWSWQVLGSLDWKHSLEPSYQSKCPQKVQIEVMNYHSFMKDLMREIVKGIKHTILHNT